ncbi:MAG: MFS transporter [Bauldia sp.]
MIDITATAPASEERQIRRNALILATASAFGAAVGPITISLGGLTGAYLLGPDKSLATLPVSGFLVGVAAGAIPAAMVMRSVGRRSGFVLGTAVAVVAGLVAGWSVLIGSFAGFTIGLALAGFAGAFVQQYRFAAADAGSPAFRAKAISWVLAGGVAAAVIGPQTVILTRDLFAPVPFAGSFFAISGLALIGMATVSLLGGEARTVSGGRTRAGGGRRLGEIVRQPRFVVALVCAIGSYTSMSLLMTAAPLAMVACGLGQDNAALGIQWHVLAMFAPSFVTGTLIARFGKEPIIATGLVLLTVCAVVALAGIELINFWLALILLGVGWNFGFVGATAMLIETYRPEEKGKVQGLNDFLVFGSVALASLSSGHLFSTVGWERINWVAFPIIGASALTLALGALGERRRTA